MIIKEITEATLPFCEMLAANGLSLNVKPNTVLSKLVAASSSTDREVSVPEVYQEISSYLYYNTESSGDVASPHDLVSSAMISDISKMVSVHIGHAKSVVKPIAQEMAKKIVDFKQNSGAMSPESKFRVSIFDIPNLLKDEFFLDELSPYRGKEMLVPKHTYISLGVRADKESIIETMLTNDESVDALIREWVESKPDNFLPVMWNNIYTKSEPLSLYSEYLTDTYSDELYYPTLVSGGKEHVALDAVLFTLLTARNLIQRVEDVEADMTLSAYRDVMEDFISYSSACICEYIRRFDLATKNNVILLSRSNKAALVNGEIFREWLNEGGCVETILGTILSDTPITTKNLINESRDKLLDKWNSYCHLAKMSAISEEHVRFRLFITNEFLRSLDSLTDDEVEYSKKNVSYLETASKLAAELIDDGKHIYSLEPYCLALKLMAKCRFFYTSAYCILKDIHEAGEVNPDIDVREAALMAVINYLGDYLFEQMSIEDGQI